MTKWRCKSCKGRDGCIHLCIFNEAQKEEDMIANMGSLRVQENETTKQKSNIETDIVDEDINIKIKPPGSKQVDSNPLNPRCFSGAETNVFKQTFRYPPQKEDREKNNFINKVDTIFPDGKMVPAGLSSTVCEEHGNVFSDVQLESELPQIHHGKPTKDSRNSSLLLFCLVTKGCKCIRFYSGEEDKLVRVSAAPAQPRSSIHFVSVDLLNEYMSTLFGKSQQGKSITAFIASKNSLNNEERGEDIKIPNRPFEKAFEIYIHATSYDAQESFNCDSCPTGLKAGETEESFSNVREVHIVDGIDMGCKESETKGFLDQEIFSTQRVAGSLLHVHGPCVPSGSCRQ
jgi:hypothetical protein